MGHAFSHGMAEIFIETGHQDQIRPAEMRLNLLGWGGPHPFQFHTLAVGVEMVGFGFIFNWAYNSVRHVMALIGQFFGQLEAESIVLDGVHPANAQQMNPTACL